MTSHCAQSSLEDLSLPFHCPLPSVHCLLLVQSFHCRFESNYINLVKDFVVGEGEEDLDETAAVHRAFDRGRDKQTEKLVEQLQVPGPPLLPLYHPHSIIECLYIFPIRTECFVYIYSPYYKVAILIPPIRTARAYILPPLTSCVYLSPLYRNLLGKTRALCPDPRHGPGRL